MIVDTLTQWYNRRVDTAHAKSQDLHGRFFVAILKTY